MGIPILPNPIKPIVLVRKYLSVFEFIEKFARDPEAAYPRGDPCVDRNLQEDLTNLLTGHSVGQGSPDVGA